LNALWISSDMNRRMGPSRAPDLAKLREGNHGAIARAISMVENDAEGAAELLIHLFPSTGRSYRIGVTGPPGAGKSTITSKLAQFYRAQRQTVGIIAVDPTSPFTGGALLGDRVRMTEVEMDAGVFIRSMASRGSLGGLSRKAVEAADVLDAAGKDIIIMETVGVGQSELDIAGAADTTVVVLVPESGDSIQAMKAGLMEIADFFVLNKADRAGADQAVMAIQMILHFRQSVEWNADVLKSVASDGIGIPEIAAQIERHRAHLEASGRLVVNRKMRLQRRVQELVADRLHVDFWSDERIALLVRRLDALAAKESTPWDVARELVESFHIP
jgi:LAO/AO transport system kinase